MRETNDFKFWQVSWLRNNLLIMNNQEDKKIKPDVAIDCTGLYCPVPIYQASKKIESMKAGQILEIIADDPSAEPDFKAWTRTTGNELLSFTKEDGKLIFLIRKAEKK